MAKPNYQFEKRQRDLAKKQKQEEKRRQKLAAKVATDGSLEAAAPVRTPQGSVGGGIPVLEGETPDSDTP